jgi:hypothetical protein
MLKNRSCWLILSFFFVVLGIEQHWALKSHKPLFIYTYVLPRGEFLPSCFYWRMCELVPSFKRDPSHALCELVCSCAQGHCSDREPQSWFAWPLFSIKTLLMEADLADGFVLPTHCGLLTSWHLACLWPSLAHPSAHIVHHLTVQYGLM